MKEQAIVSSSVYYDLHKLESSMYGWDVVFKKISIGNFHGTIHAIDLGMVQLIDVRMSGIVFQKGLTPKDYITFAIPAVDSQAFRWHHRYADQPSLLLFPLDRELNAVSYDGFHVYILSIHKHFLDELLTRYQMESIREQFNGDKKMMPIVKPHIYSLYSILQALFLSIQVYQKQNLSMASYKKVKYGIPEQVLQIASQNLEKDSIPIKRQRDLNIATAIEFMLSRDLKTLTVKEVSLQTGIKLRTLEYAFKEYFNVGPKNFMMALRLNDFRHSLINEAVAVSECAFDHGFTHMGQLSRDFKLLFGELPRETLRWAKIERFQAKPEG